MHLHLETSERGELASVVATLCGGGQNLRLSIRKREGTYVLSASDFPDEEPELPLERLVSADVVRGAN